MDSCSSTEMGYSLFYYLLSFTMFYPLKSCFVSDLKEREANPKPTNKWRRHKVLLRMSFETYEVTYLFQWLHHIVYNTFPPYEPAESLVLLYMMEGVWVNVWIKPVIFSSSWMSFLSHWRMVLLCSSPKEPESDHIRRIIMMDNLIS